MAKTTVGKECRIVDYMECFIHVWALFRWKIYVEMSSYGLIHFEPTQNAAQALGLQLKI